MILGMSLSTFVIAQSLVLLMFIGLTVAAVKAFQPPVTRSLGAAA